MNNLRLTHAAAVLGVLQPGDSVADVAWRLERAKRSLAEGSIYAALRWMVTRGFLTETRGPVISADGRKREIGFYTATEAGRKAVAALVRA